MPLRARRAFDFDGRSVQPGDRLDVAPGVAVALVARGWCVFDPSVVQHRDPVRAGHA